MTESILRTDGLAVGYDGRVLVDEIAIDLRRGEILTLVGPNGSGKTTILKTLAGQLRPIGGTILLAGASLATLPPLAIARKLALVLTLRQSAGRQTCEDVVSAGRQPYTGHLGVLSPADRAEIHRAMELVHTLDLRTTDLGAISDGQRQRVLLARAICQQPEVIVLDEPTSFLDIKYKLELLSVLKTMAREQQVAVVLSLHELDLAQKISDTVLCVRDGKIERQGSPESVLTADYIRQLYDLEGGSYNDTFGCLELEAPRGAPEVFVIAGGGSGVSTFRRLQREGCPFATGVLHPGDVDYAVASALAARVIAERDFEPIGRESLEQAKRVLAGCRRVICCPTSFGTVNQGNQALLLYAKALGLPVEQAQP
ncbi:MAG: ABC transporter ATP-binding protein [Oscillospiraceae bacterium]